MRLLLQGGEGNLVLGIRTGDIGLQVQLLNDDGSPLSIASPAVVTLEFFTTQARADTGAVVKTVTPGAGAAAGFGVCTIDDLDTALARNTFYVWARYSSNGSTGPSSTVLISGIPAKVQIL